MSQQKRTIREQRRGAERRRMHLLRVGPDTDLLAALDRPGLGRTSTAAPSERVGNQGRGDADLRAVSDSMAKEKAPHPVEGAEPAQEGSRR